MQAYRPIVNFRIKSLARLGLVMAFALVLGGCSTVSYYSQAVGGHLKLMLARQPIDELLSDDKTPPELREKLQTLLEARQFATEQLLLPNNGSYSSYVETGGNAITWNVVAAEEFALQAKTWCFPVAGCVSYRGYFEREDALDYAKQLESEQYDVIVGGASAYSTLGWFDDPVLDTMLSGDDLRFVGTLFHELAHQVLYVKGDSDFNEAFATFVEQLGVHQWLSERGEIDRIDTYETSEVRAEEFVDLLKQTRDALQALYTQELPTVEMREAKQLVFTEMRANYALLKQTWGGYAGYDGWFKRDLNNARLLAVSTYRRNVPAFEGLYKEAGEDWAAFYALAREMAALDYDARQQRLAQYL